VSDAERFLSEQVTDIAVVVPSALNPRECAALMDAGAELGICLRTMRYSDAIAYAYGCALAAADDSAEEHLLATFHCGERVSELGCYSIGDGVVETVWNKTLDICPAEALEFYIVDQLLQALKPWIAVTDSDFDNSVRENVVAAMDVISMLPESAFPYTVDLRTLYPNAEGTVTISWEMLMDIVRRQLDGLTGIIPTTTWTLKAQPELYLDAGKRLLVSGDGCDYPTIIQALKELGDSEHEIVLYKDEPYEVQAAFLFASGIFGHAETQPLLLTAYTGEISLRTELGSITLKEQGDTIPSTAVKELFIADAIDKPVDFLICYKDTEFLWARVPGLAKGSHLFVTFEDSPSGAATGMVTVADTGTQYPFTAEGLDDRAPQKAMLPRTAWFSEDVDLEAYQLVYGSSEADSTARDTASPIQNTPSVPITNLQRILFCGDNAARMAGELSRLLKSGAVDLWDIQRWLERAE
jgi:hypothetical protein